MAKIIAEIVDKGIERAKKAMEGLADSSKKSGKQIDQVNKEIKETEKSSKALSKGVKAVGVAMAATFSAHAISRFAKTSVEAFTVFDKAAKQLSAITGLAGEDLDRLTDSAKRLADESTKSGAEVLEAFKLIGSAKPELLQDVDALELLTEAAITLSEASGLTLPDAATNLGSALNALQLPASEAANLINVLAAASQKGAKEIPFVVDALSKFGGISSQAGLKIEESVSAIELLGKAIPEASIVGTNLRAILIKLQVEAQKNGREFNSLGEELERLAPDVDNIGKLTKLFGDNNLLAIQTLIAQREELGNLQESITGTSTALEQQRINNESAQATFKRFQNSIKSLKVEYGELLFNAIRPIITGLTGLVSVLTKLPKFVRENKTAFKLLGVALLGLKFNAIISQVKILRLAFVAFRATTLSTAAATGGVTKALKFLKVAIASNPVGLLVTVLYTVAASLLFFRKKTDDATEGLHKLGEEVDSVSAKLGGEILIQLDNLQRKAAGIAGNDFLTKIGDQTEDFAKRIKSLTTGELESLKLFLEGDLQKALALTRNQFDEFGEETLEFLINQESAQETQKLLDLVNTELKKIPETIKEVKKETSDFAKGSLTDLQNKLKALQDQLLKAPDNNALISKLVEQIQIAEKNVENLKKKIDSFRDLGDEEPIPIEVELVLKDPKEPFDIDDPGITPEIDFSEMEEDTDQFWEDFENDAIEAAQLAKDAFQAVADGLKSAVDSASGLNVSGILGEFENLITVVDSEGQFSEFEKGLATAATGLSVFSQFEESITASRLARLEQQKESGQISEEEFARRRAEILRQEAIFQKVTGISQAIINTAIGVSQNIGNPFLAAATAALGAAQIALIVAQPIPEVPSFFHGTESLPLGNNKKGRDTITIRAHEGERIINSNDNKAYYDDYNILQRKKVKPGFLKSIYENRLIPSGFASDGYKINYAALGGSIKTAKGDKVDFNPLVAASDRARYYNGKKQDRANSTLQRIERLLKSDRVTNSKI